MAFHDIRPKAPVHVLVVPKEHVEKLSDYPDTEEGERKLGAPLPHREPGGAAFGPSGLPGPGERGEKGGQEVFHVHVHVMGGWG